MDIIENNIDKLIALIEFETGINTVLYIELISVEIRENSFFKIAGKGYNIDNYLRSVSEHLRVEENSSLLLMKHYNDSGFHFLNKRLKREKLNIEGHDSNEELHEPNENMNFYNIKRRYRKTEELREGEVDNQWEKWVEMARSSFPDMQHACFLHSEMTIPLSKNPIKIISGIWVFFSDVVYELEDLQRTLKTGIYEYIIFTLLPDKIRQDTFDSLAHSQKQYIHAIKSISKRLGGKDQQMLEYLYNSLNGFLAISKSYHERTLENIREEKISLSDVLKHIIQLLENLILADKEILDLSIKGNDNRLDNLYANNTTRTLFSGNFRDIDLSTSIFRMYVPQILVKEAIVNSLENADSNNPKIEINFIENEHEVILSISNNGLATIQDIQEMLYPQNPYKLGCRLIIDLSNILGWTFRAESNFKDQTTYLFIINK